MDSRFKGDPPRGDQGFDRAGQPFVSAAARQIPVSSGIRPTLPGCWKKLAGMMAITLFWCGITSVFLVISLGSILKHKDAQRRFVSTEGIVLTSKVKRHEGDSDSGPTYSTLIKYRYSADGRQYISTRYAYGMGSTSEFEYAQSVVAEHPAGKKVRVWYDPEDPGEAILELETPGIHYFLLLFFQPFLVAALGLIAYTISIPFTYARARQFMSEATPIFGRIPGWGTAAQNVRGITIRPAQGPLRLVIAFGTGYGLACFAGIFIAGFLLGGFSDPDPEVIFRTFYAAAAIGVTAMLVSLLRPRKKATLEIDISLGQLSLRSPTRDFRVASSDIESWTLRTINDPKGMIVNNRVLTRPLLAVRTNDGQEVPIRVFGTAAHAHAIARKAGEGLAELTGAAFTESTSQEPPGPLESPETPGELLRLFARQKRGQEQYKDIM